MSEDFKRYDLAEIRKAVAILFADVKFGAGECVEVRMIDKKKHLVAAGWFDDTEVMAKTVARLARDGFGQASSYRHIHENVYWTANPVTDALLARQEKNRIDFAAETTSDSNITRRLWLPIDIDPIRASGVSATTDEKRLALKVMQDLYHKLGELGFPDSCVVGGTSGNGYHALIRIDLPNDSESRDLIKKCLAALQGLVGTQKVEIDPKVFNAARIIKCYGTLSCKGQNTPDRPWRWSKLTSVPESITGAGRELLVKLAAMAPDKNAKRDLPTEKRQGPWTLENTQAYIDWTDWEHGDQQPGGQPNETAKWLGVCLNDDNHKDAALILHTDGWWSFGCFHSSCKHNTHKEFMAHWEEEKGEAYTYPGRRKFDDLSDVAGLLDFLEAPTAEVPAKKEPKKFHLTDSGNSERLVYRYGHLFRYCPQRDWYAWDGRRWVPDSENTIYQAALRVAREIPEELPLHLDGVEDEKERAAMAKSVHRWALSSESRNHQTAIEFLSQSKKGVAVNISKFDTDKWLFNCENGTLELSNFYFREHAQNDMITNISPVVYDPKATCPLWDQFMDEIMDGDAEMVAFLKRCAGYSLTGSTAEHCMFLCWGTGRNGKSTFLEVLRYVIGTYGQQASMATFLAKKADDGIPNDIAALRDARFVTAIETDDGKQLAEAKIKLITGGDEVTARFLHKEFFSFMPQFKIWMATNYKPAIVGTDEGIWRRIHLIPFTVYIPDGKKDEKLRGKLISEASGILNWALEGLNEFVLGGLMAPDKVRVATEEYRAGEDWLVRFMETETVKDSAGQVQARALFERFKFWAEAANENTRIKEKRFNESMNDHGYPYIKINNKKLYTGFRLRDAMERYADKFGNKEKTLEDVEVL